MIAALVPLVLAHVVLWHAVRPGVWRHEGPMAATGALAVVQATAIRLRPEEHRFVLAKATRDYGMRGAWTIDSMPPDAVLAFNAGHFIGGIPWGWVVVDGIEQQTPGSGSLAMAFVVDSAGDAALVTPNERSAVRGGATLAFQSYPALLVEGELPWELRADGRGVDRQHRDSRLAVCSLPDGSLVVAITRFSALGRAAGTLPWGPTVPEMADYMRSLGCRRAMLLDGGMSSQLAARQADGSITRWPNWRAVPLGIVVTPRDRGNGVAPPVASRSPGEWH